jgi:glycosyltransferase involved in cell wall biosynthesis
MEAVFAQSYSPVEIIVMDDGSTDGTDELMAGYGDRVRYYWQASQGVAVARTRASELAQGELIAYQDDDDLMPKDRISSLYGALDQYPDAVLATGDYALIDQDGALTGRRWLPGPLDERGETKLLDDGHEAILWPKVPAVPHTTLFRKRDGERVGWFDQDFRYACSDADFLARLGALGPIAYVRQVVSYYRRGHSAIWRNELKAGYSRLQLWTKHMPGSGDSSNILRDRLRQRIAMTLALIARQESWGRRLDDPEMEIFRHRAMKMLGSKARIRYEFFRNVKLPIRNAIRGKG